jgi:hypothetical protein
LDVRIAQELIDQARAQGVSLVGPGGLLSQVRSQPLTQTSTLAIHRDDRVGVWNGV